MLDISLSKLTAVKVRRNTLRNANTSGVDNTTIYSEYDEEKPKNRISVIGNPSLGQIKVMMIGVRNNTASQKSAIIWVNAYRDLCGHAKPHYRNDGVFGYQRLMQLRSVKGE